MPVARSNGVVGTKTCKDTKKHTSVFFAFYVHHSTILCMQMLKIIAVADVYLIRL